MLIPAFALALLLAMWLSVTYQIAAERQTAHNEAVAHSQSLARTLADHVSHILRQTDHATELFKLKFEETNGALGLPEFTRRNGLMESVLPSRLDLPVALISPVGEVIDSAHGFARGNVVSEPYFQALARTNNDAPVFSSPVVDPGSKKWLIQVARRLSTRDGQFAGVIAIRIDPTYFVDDYDRLNVEDEGAVVLVSRDGGLSLGRAAERMFTSDSVDFVGAGDATEQSDELTPLKPLDAIARIYSFRDMPRYALMAVVGVTERAAMARFARHREIYLGVAAVATVLILAIFALLMQQSERLRASMRAAHEAQAILRAAAVASLDGVLILHAWPGNGRPALDFVAVEANGHGASLLGLPPSAPVSGRIANQLRASGNEALLERYFQVHATGLPVEEELTIERPGQPLRWLHHQVVPIDDGVAITARDITARKNDEMAIRAHQAELEAVNDASPLGLMRADQRGLCTYVNRTFSAITGLTREEALGDGWLNAVHPVDREVMLHAREQMAASHEPFQAIVRCLHPNGKTVWTSVKIAPIRIDGKIEGYVGSTDDITVLREAEIALRESEARLRTIADTLPAMVAYIDADQTYRFYNISYEREFGQQGMQVHGKAVRETVGEVRYAILEPYINRVLAGEEVNFEETDQRGGVERNLAVTYIPQRGDAGNVVGFHVIRQDVTSQQREKKRLMRLAQIDALTGLTNRAGFMQKLGDAMADAAAVGSLMAVMYLDIDRFKPVNDTYGHNVGDALLKAFSGRLTHTLRASDTIARLGGDEFTIIMEKIPRKEDAAHIAAKIVAVMDAPFAIEEISVSVSASIGLAFYRTGDMTPEALLKQADVLLYQAKQAGRNTYRAAA